MEKTKNGVALFKEMAAELLVSFRDFFNNCKSEHLLIILNITAVKVTPRSIKHKDESNLNCDVKSEPMSFDKEKLTAPVEVIYTYSVTFEVLKVIILPRIEILDFL